MCSGAFYNNNNIIIIIVCQYKQAANNNHINMPQQEEDTTITTLQVMGVNAMCWDHETFEMLSEINLPTRNIPFRDFTTTTEKTNYKISPHGTLHPVKERFFHFQHERDALDLLALGEGAFKGPAGHQLDAYFMVPKHDPATRAKLRQIAALIARVKEIDTELKRLGAVRDGAEGVFKLDTSRFIDKSFFLNKDTGLPAWKRARTEGAVLDHHTYEPLRHSKPVNTVALMERFKELHNEQCDALIRLREFQLYDGLDFTF
jgi:hypothetical protein